MAAAVIGRGRHLVAMVARCVVVVFCTCAAPFAVSADEIGERIEIRFSHEVAEDSPKGIGATLFKQRVEEALPGRVKVEIYPRSRKFKDSEVVRALLFGNIEMAAPSLSKLTSYAGSLEVFDLPMIFPDVDAVHRFQESAIGQGLLGSLRSMGIAGLAYWDNGMRVISANRPLRVPEDARGMLFRVERSQILNEQYSRLGAIPRPLHSRLGATPRTLPFVHLTDGIRNGYPNGQENAWSDIRSRGIHHFHKYFTELNHNFLGYMVITNARFWDGLPADVRSVLEDVLARTTEDVRELAREHARASRREIMETEGVEILTPSGAELTSWREALCPVAKRFATEIPNEVLAAARAAVREEGFEVAARAGEPTPLTTPPCPF
jgi:C4-dicarboxylate-binding protein DctP